MRPKEMPLRWDPIRPFVWHGPVRDGGEVGRREGRDGRGGGKGVPVGKKGGEEVRDRGEGVRGKPVPGMPGQGELGWGW